MKKIIFCVCYDAKNTIDIYDVKPIEKGCFSGFHYQLHIADQNDHSLRSKVIASCTPCVRVVVALIFNHYRAESVLFNASTFFS
ncbi:MAG: hypothetical protein COA99_19365 [Moraxellaceae bacterium]|nr:MAG: hypothetical protein COA99_19365 [Moraxellaceae bacterium]